MIQPIKYRMYDTSEFCTLQLDGVPQTLDPAEGRGIVLSARQSGNGDGDVIRVRASPKHYDAMTG